MTRRPTPPDGAEHPPSRREAHVDDPVAAARRREAHGDDPAGAVRRREAARAAAVRAHRRRGLRRLGVLLAVVLGAAWLGYVLLFSSVLGVRSVEVVGTGVLSADEVRAAAGVPAGRPMLRLDTGAVADRVQGLLPVAGVQVERSWPSTVMIRITERAPVAFVVVPDGARLVDATGLDFATVPVPPQGLPELATNGPEATTAAASVLATLAEPSHDQLRAELVAVRAESPFDVRLTLRGDRTVRWGSAADSARKAAVLAVLLSQPGTTYDVASPDLPTIK